MLACLVQEAAQDLVHRPPLRLSPSDRRVVVRAGQSLESVGADQRRNGGYGGLANRLGPAAPRRSDCPPVGHVDVSRVGHELPDGRVLLDDVSFRVGDGAKVALVGANGAGKTTLLRIVAGDVGPAAGVGHPQRRPRRDAPVRRLGPRRLDRARPAGVGRARRGPRGRRGRVDAAELRDDGARRRADPDALRPGAGRLGRRRRLRGRGRLGRLLHRGRSGIPCEQAAVARRCARCPAASRSGWCSRRCCAGPTRCCCSTSRTTTSTSRASAGSRSALRETPKTVLFVSHDRELLARTATRIVTVERRRHAPGRTAAASRPTTRPASDRHERLEELRRRWDEEHARLKDAGHGRCSSRRRYSPDMASRYHAMQTRLRKFEEAGPPRGAARRSRTSRCGCAAAAPASGRSTCEGLELTGLMQPFDLEVCYGERVAVLGSNGRASRTSCGCWPAWPVAHTGAGGSARGSCPATSRQTHEHPELAAAPLLDILLGRHRVAAARAGDRRRCAATSWTTRRSSRSRRCPAASRRGSRSCCWSSTGATLLLLDEPTDNLDLARAEALEDGLRGVRRDGRRGHPRPVVRPRRSTGSWSSARTAGSTRRPSRSGTRAGSTAPADPAPGTPASPRGYGAARFDPLGGPRVA